MPEVSILWLRRDLRLTDNPALQAALQGGRAVLPVYIHAPEEQAPWAPGAATNWWLHHSLQALAAALQARGSRLLIRLGPSLDTLRQLVTETGARALHWNRLYEPMTLARDTAIKDWAKAEGLEVHSHNAALLHEPWILETGKGEPYRVFTPFWKRCLTLPAPPPPSPAPAAIPAPSGPLDTLPLEALGLLPSIPWDAGLAAQWQPGEDSALTRLHSFLSAAVSDYDSGREQPAIDGTSALSAALHHGELGPRQVWHACQALRHTGAGAESVTAYLREIYWREFAHHLIWHYPQTPEAPLNARYADFPWPEEDDTAALQAWQRGRTGIPMVDAGMRQLWATGWMHNRVRMIVASLLTKNLLTPWQRGAAWFWDTLVDADLAANTLGWQWAAGCGADAAPYFRIFNPVLQGERFDPAGDYVRRWVPELAALPGKWIHQPWAAPPLLLRGAGIELGRTYPHPIVDLKASRQRALAAWDTFKNTA